MKLQICAVFLLLWNLCIAQTAKIDHRIFEAKDGLQLDIISAMAFDDDGSVWLGGCNLNVRTIILSDQKLMLQRFNGKTFHNVPLPEREKTITLVDQIYKREDGKLYIGVVAEKPLPKITKIENGRPDVFRPDIFENHLKNTREIVSYIIYFRQQKAKEKI